MLIIIIVASFTMVHLMDTSSLLQGDLLYSDAEYVVT